MGLLLMVIHLDTNLGRELDKHEETRYLRSEKYYRLWPHIGRDWTLV